MSEQRYGRRAIETGPTGRVVAANIERLRKLRGLTTRQLSAALDKAGRSVSASGITRMEKAERHVTADELVALAVVLDVSPVTLLLPADARGTTEVTGAGEVDTRAAWQWAWCNDPLRFPDTADPEEAHRYQTEFLLRSRPIGLFSPQRDDRVPGFIRDGEGGGDGPSVD